MGQVQSRRVYRPERLAAIYVQPCDEGGDGHDAALFEANRKNMLLAAEIAMRHGYRLLIQLHKIVGLA